MDICGTFSFMPLIMVNFLETQSTISFPGCALQMYPTLALGSMECVLLAMMVHDWYVAICQLLCYSELMSWHTSMWMVALSWGEGFANSLLHSNLTWSLPFCGHNIINPFFCENLAVLKLACGDISLNALILTVSSAVVTLPPLLLIFLSYVFILTALLRVPSAAGQHKAFSTCSAHLTVVVISMGLSPSCISSPRPRTSTWISFLHCSTGS